VRKIYDTAKARLDQGKSGYFLIVPSEHVVRKGCARAGAGESRLRAQCLKQASFTIATKGFEVCPVTGSAPEGEPFWFEMPFYLADSYVSFCDKASVEKVHSFKLKILELVDEFVNASPVYGVKTSIVLEKSRTTFSNISPQLISTELGAAFTKHIDEISCLGPEINLPMGKCHGDLTFANILFPTSGKLILVDFLDSYIESPILDIAKVLQETALSWSSLVAKEVFDQTKAMVLARHLDTSFRGAFIKYDFYRSYGRIFEFQNLLRVLPYLSDQALIEIIQRRLINIQDSEKT
jgi:Choline/ethanolamine kinase